MEKIACSEANFVPATMFPKVETLIENRETSFDRKTENIDEKKFSATMFSEERKQGNIDRKHHVSAAMLSNQRP